MDLSKTLKWRDGNGNANANAKVSTIALPVLCTGELKINPYICTDFSALLMFLQASIGF